MTSEELNNQLEKLKVELSVTETQEYLDSIEDLLKSKLEQAEYSILEKRYPLVDFTETDEDDNPLYPLEKKYYRLQIDIAIALYNRIGAEGESQHTENGVSRTYQSGGDVADNLLNRVVPKGRVL